MKNWTDKYNIPTAQSGTTQPKKSWQELLSSDEAKRLRELKAKKDMAKIKIKSERQETVKDNTPNFKPKEVKTRLAESDKVRDARITKEREVKIQASVDAQNTPYTTNNWRQQLAAETNATGDKFRISNKPNIFDDYLNPAVMIGDMASGLGQAPLRAEQTDSYMPYITSIGTPLAVGVLAGMGAQNTGQFVNNIANPLAGTGELLNKYNPVAIAKDYIKKGEIKSLLKDTEKLLNTEEGRKRLLDLGISPQQLKTPSLSFEKGVGNNYLEGNINIDFSELRQLKKEGWNLNHKTVADHEIGHWLQEERIKNSDEYLNKVMQHQTALDDYNAKTPWYVENNKFQGEPPKPPDIYSVNVDYNTNADKFLQHTFGTNDETTFFTNVNKKSLNRADAEIRLNNAAHFASPQEPLAFVREMRRNMLNGKYIKNQYDPISEETINAFIKENPKDRISSILWDDPKLIKGIKNVINGIPSVVPITGVAGATYLATQDELPKQQNGGTTSPWYNKYQ